MGIWIRSQNKMTLINCKKFEINVENDCYEILANSGRNETYDYIGGYSSKEQAIKVLDMLENCIVEAEDGITYHMFNMPQDDEVVV